MEDGWVEGLIALGLIRAGDSAGGGGGRWSGRMGIFFPTLA